MTRSATIALAVVSLSFLAILFPGRIRASQSNVFVTGIICQSQLSAYQRAIDRMPTVYVDNNATGVQHPVKLEAFNAADGFFQLSFNTPAGFHGILIATKYGGAFATLDVLAGHSRYIVLKICDGLL